VVRHTHELKSRACGSKSARRNKVVTGTSTSTSTHLFHVQAFKHQGVGSAQEGIKRLKLPGVVGVVGGCVVADGLELRSGGVFGGWGGVACG